MLTDADGARRLADLPPARDFVSDAFAHCKFVGHSGAAAALFEAVGLADKLDEGFAALRDEPSVNAFVDQCAQSRVWEREAAFRVDGPDRYATPACTAR